MGQNGVRAPVGAHGVGLLPRQTPALLEEGRQCRACFCASRELRIHQTLHWSPGRYKHVLEPSLVSSFRAEGEQVLLSGCCWLIRSERVGPCLAARAVCTEIAFCCNSIFATRAAVLASATAAFVPSFTDTLVCETRQSV